MAGNPKKINSVVHTKETAFTKGGLPVFELAWYTAMDKLEASSAACAARSS